MFWENFYFLCTDAEMKPLQVVKKIGISHGSITKWKQGAVPSAPSLQKIADFFNVSVDYLLGKEKPTAEAVGNDDQLFTEAEQLMGSLSPARQEEAMRYLRYLASQEGKDTP